MARFPHRTGRACAVALALLCAFVTAGATGAQPRAESGLRAAPGDSSTSVALLVPRRTRLIINYRRSVLA